MITEEQRRQHDEWRATRRRLMRPSMPPPVPRDAVPVDPPVDLPDDFVSVMRDERIDDPSDPVSLPDAFVPLMRQDRPGEGNVRRVQRVVSERFGIPFRVLAGFDCVHARNVAIVHARHVAMWLCVAVLGETKLKTGHCFRRDHTTVLHAVRRVGARREADASFAAELDELAREVER